MIPVRQPNDGTYSSLIASGKIELLDKDVQQALINLRSAYTYLLDINENFEPNLFNSTLEFTRKYKGIGFNQKKDGTGIHEYFSNRKVDQFDYALDI